MILSFKTLIVTNDFDDNRLTLSFSNPGDIKSTEVEANDFTIPQDGIEIINRVIWTYLVRVLSRMHHQADYSSGGKVR